jgi:hypothetical protein
MGIHTNTPEYPWRRYCTDAYNQKRRKIIEKKKPRYNDLFFIAAVQTPPRQA